MFQRITKSHKQASNQVSMLQSRFDSDMYAQGVKLPAAICQRSPLRSRGSNPLSNNASKQGTPNKKYPSPLLSRRDSNVSTNSFLNSQAHPGPQIKTSKMRQTVRQQSKYSIKPIQDQPLEKVGILKQIPLIKTQRQFVPIKQNCDQTKYCSNTIHDPKPATYLVCSEDNNILHYCQKCAILLASQGWKVKKIQEEVKEIEPEAQLQSEPEPLKKQIKIISLEQSRTRSLQASLQSKNMRAQALNSLQNNQRKSQLTLFLNEVNTIYYQFKAKRSSIKSVIITNNESQKQLDKYVNDYFNKLIKTIQNQKKIALQEIQAQRVKVNQQAQEQLNQLVKSMDDCSMMLDDIFSSIDLIKHIDDKSFNKVMDIYKAKCKEHLDFGNKTLPLQITLPNLTLIDLEALSQKINSITKIKFKQRGKQNISLDSNKVQFSFDKRKSQQNHSLKMDQNQNLKQSKKMNTQVDERYIKKFDDSNDCC